MGFKNRLLGMARSKSENSLAFFNMLGPIILNGINFFTVPIFTRLLGPANYAIVAIYIAWVQILTLIVGLQTVSSIGIARVHIGADKQNEYRSSILSLSLTSLIAVSALILIFLGPVSRFLELNTVMIVVMILQSFGAYVISFTTTTYTYDKKAQKTFLISVVTALSTVALSLVLLSMTPDGNESRAYARIFGMAIPNILIGVIFFIVFVVRGKTTFSKEYWKFCLPLALPLIFHGLSHVVLSQADKVMLQKMVNNEIAGIYSFVVIFTHMINVIWLALNNTWVPFYYDDMKNGESAVVKRKSRNYMVLFTVITMGFVLLSPEVAQLFSSSDFWSGIDLIPIFALSMFMVFLYSFPVNFQLFYKRSIHVAIGTSMAAVLNIVLNALLIPLMGMYGAAIATMISYISLFIFHQIITRFVIKHDYHFGFKDYWLAVVLVGLSMAAFYLLKDFWYVRWVIGAALGAWLLRRVIKNRTIF